jgi:hypothetical protein
VISSIAALAYKKLLALAFPSQAQTVDTSYAIRASPASFSEAKIKLVKSLWLQEAALFMKYFIAATASQMINTLCLIIA